ncbi:glucosidase family protein [Flavihumibacter profundi]|uniref:hypothetical protein n=1 Tax=Flavihumibacter profundi TaxID=2716883 RepID=UPI001CC4B430|nr:hypothetical protein [Flavihumibacter profundi]MBZ5859365.1 hypothetical protein [Flavihumibacter profundi]
MKSFHHTIIALLFFTSGLHAQETGLVKEADLSYLKALTKAVLESSRIYPGQIISKDFGPNNTGGILIRPGGRDCYPSFWIRDYAMSLESEMVSVMEQKHMLRLAAVTQCDQTWVTRNGSMVPLGAIADHIRIDDSQPIYFPGTYDYAEQGNKQYGMTPPYDDQFFFIHMAYFYVKTSADSKILLQDINGMRLIDRLETAFKVPPSRQDNHIVYATQEFRGVDFGFRDAIAITGDLCFSSILKFRAAKELAVLFEMMQNKGKAAMYREIAAKIKKAIPGLFSDQRGMLLASTGKSRQPDVWATALAVYLNVLEGDVQKKTCRFLADAYKNGTLSYHGNIRHILTSDDYNNSTAWELTSVDKNTYQNGAYWGTPTGWVCFAIAKADFPSAQKLAKEYIDDLQKNDYRKGKNYGAPYECFYPNDYSQNPVYLTTVSCPYAVFKSAIKFHGP